MFISKAMAQVNDTVNSAAAAAADTPSAWEAFALNMLLIVILVVMFYVLLIMPQQKRFKKHRSMIEQLRKGDEIVTVSGMIGKIDKIKDGDDEVVIDLGDGMKVKMLRSSIQNKYQG